MSKSDQLAELFTEWKLDLSGQEFYEDGIINESLYDSVPAGKKLLVIAKEPNGRNHEANSLHSFITEWNDHKPDYRFACTIGDWAFGFLNNFPKYDTISKENKLSALKQIAFMNVKKTPGGSDVPDKDILGAVDRSLRCLKDQITIISPDVIICCLGFNEIVIGKLFDGIQLVPSGHGIKTAEWNGKRIIEFYHPSVRGGPAAFYNLLKEVILSKY